MLKISDLQSQIALNRRLISAMEDDINDKYSHITFLKHTMKYHDLDKVAVEDKLSDCHYRISFCKKKIKQYAKLQRALKDELAYRIQYNRAAKEIEALTEKAKVEGWEVVIVDDNKYNEMLKGE